MRWTSILLSCLLLLATVSAAEEGGLLAPPEPARAFPNVVLSPGESLRYVGTFYADGIYRQNSALGKFYEADAKDEQERPGIRPPEVPARVDLHPLERTNENFLPQAHATKRAERHSRVAEWFNNLVTLAYGRERTFVAPKFVTTDTNGRVIVGDPAGNAVHVLDPQRPFRVVAGAQYRLRSVGAVATDADNNIYVADPDQGVIVVLDPVGRFVRTIGQFAEREGLFHNPASIAVDRQRHLLHVLDSSREMLFTLDLSGNVLWKAGGRRHEMNVQFDKPIALTARNGIVAVLDGQGSRVLIFDWQGTLWHRFDVATNAVALQFDPNGRIYLTDTGGNDMHIFGADGRPEACVGVSGERRGEFSGASGLWIDDAERIYVAESGNRRVQVFQISGEHPH